MSKNTVCDLFLLVFQWQLPCRPIREEKLLPQPIRDENQTTPSFLPGLTHLQWVFYTDYDVRITDEGSIPEIRIWSILLILVEVSIFIVNTPQHLSPLSHVLPSICSLHTPLEAWSYCFWDLRNYVLLVAPPSMGFTNVPYFYKLSGTDKIL